MGPEIVKIFSRGKEEKQRRQDFAFNVGLATAQGKAQGRAMSTQTRQQINSLGETYFLMQDENMLELVLRNKPELFPVISRLNSTSKIDEKRDKELLELYLDDMILHEEMDLEEDENPVQLQFLKAFRYYGFFRILDAMKGYRGTLVTEARERMYVETGERKKKGWL